MKTGQSAGLLLFLIVFFPLAIYVDRHETERRDQAMKIPLAQLPGRVVMYHTTRCGACKAMFPVVDQLRQAGYPISSIDVGADRETGQEMGIRSVPTFVYFENGEEKRRKVGGMQPQTLQEYCRGL